MKIRRLRIDDFGIIRNQTLEDISSGMVVIGGPNRAGKTTFLKLLRCLGYGFKGQPNLPPPTNKYRVEGDFVLETGDMFNLLIEGESQPRVSCIKGTPGDVQTSTCLYNNLDSFTYQQLFTISLEELNRLPQTMGKGDEEKLQSVLLGAGLKDVIQVSPVEEEIKKEAEKLGGKRGNLSVKQFKPYNNEINEGLELREKAKSQVTIYHEKIKEKEEIEQKITEMDDEIEELAKKIIRLEQLKNWHKSYQRINELHHTLERDEVKNILENEPSLSLERLNQLWGDYENALNDYEKLIEVFSSKIDTISIKEASASSNETGQNREKILYIKDILINSFGELEKYSKNLSGLRERFNSYQEQKEELENNRKSLEKEGNDLKEGLGDNLENLRKIKTDHLSQSRLSELVEEYNDTFRQKKEATENKEKYKEELEHLKSQIQELEVLDAAGLLQKYFILASGLIISGGIIGIFHLLGGILLGTTGLVGLGLYMFIKYQNNSQKRMLKSDLETKIERNQKFYQEEKEKEEENEAKLEELSHELEKYRKELLLDSDVNPLTIKEQFQKLVELKDKLENLILTEKKVEKKERELETELQKLHEVLDPLYKEVYGKELNEQISRERLLDEGDELLLILEQTYALAELARELELKEQAKNKVLDKLYKEANIDQFDLQNKTILEALQSLKEHIINYKKFKEKEEELLDLKSRLLASLKSDRVKEAFGIHLDYLPGKENEDEVTLNNFEYYWNQFASSEEVEKAYYEAEKMHQKLKEDLDELKHKKSQLDLELSDLATDENLQKAQAKIDEGRKKLWPLAEKYAIQKGAAFLLSEAKNMFLENARDSLLKEANLYLKEITGGEYCSIKPAEDLKNMDFQVEKVNGDKANTTEVLSRGTREQLYLAVRLSRIKEISPPLPVILDDTLANFDMYHLDRTASLLAELSNTRQIFVLTCHPELVKAIGEYANYAQFLRLEAGNFFRTKEEELIESLSR